jgi:hypothetical protein
MSWSCYIRNQRPSAPHQGSRAADHRSEHVDARASERMH